MRYRGRHRELRLTWKHAAIAAVLIWLGIGLGLWVIDVLDSLEDPCREVVCTPQGPIPPIPNPTLTP